MKENAPQIKKEVNILPKITKDREKTAKKETILDKYSYHPYDKIKFSKNKRYKLFKKLNLLFFILINFIIGLNSINKISSDMAISITTISFNRNNYYEIINTTNIGKPSEIYVNNNKIENMQNFLYKYEDNYLKISSTNNWNTLEIKLFWKSDISKIITSKDDTPTEKIADTSITNEMTNTYDIISYSGIISESDLNEEIPKEGIPKEVDEIIPTYFILPENFTLNAQNLFYECSIIKYIDFLEFDSSIITNMNRMFYY